MTACLGVDMGSGDANYMNHFLEDCLCTGLSSLFSVALNAEAKVMTLWVEVFGSQGI